MIWILNFNIFKRWEREEKVWRWPLKHLSFFISLLLHLFLAHERVKKKVENICWHFTFFNITFIYSVTKAIRRIFYRFFNASDNVCCMMGNRYWSRQKSEEIGEKSEDKLRSSIMRLAREQQLRSNENKFPHLGSSNEKMCLTMIVLK